MIEVERSLYIGAVEEQVHSTGRLPSCRPDEAERVLDRLDGADHAKTSSSNPAASASMRAPIVSSSG